LTLEEKKANGLFILIKRSIPEKGSLKLTINTDACKNTKDEVNYLEHVQAFITLKSSRRGNTVIFITSPLGTR
jgi:proprotein convertase subtilisin/kexin type 2